MGIGVEAAHEDTTRPWGLPCCAGQIDVEGSCYDWLSSKIREAYEDEQGRRRALVQRERSKARQSGWRQDVLSE